MNFPDDENEDLELNHNENEPLLGSKDKAELIEEKVGLSEESQEVLFEDESPPKKLKLNRD